MIETRPGSARDISRAIAMETIIRNGIAAEARAYWKQPLTARDARLKPYAASVIATTRSAWLWTYV